MSGFFRVWLQAALGVVRTDFALLLRDPRALIFNVVPPLALLLILGGFGAAGSRVPVALAPLGQGPYTAALVELAATVRSPTSPYFRILTRDPAAAHLAYTQGRVLGLIEIPADFDTRVAGGEPASFTLRLHNLNADQAKNYRMRAALLAWRFNHEVLPEARYPVRTTAVMREDRPLEVPFHHNLAAGVIPLAVLLGGLLGGGLGLAREFEAGRIRQMLLSPAPRTALVAGKLGAGVLEAAVAGGLTYAMGRAVFGLPVEGPAGSVLLVALFLAAYGVALGALLGASLRRLPPVVVISIFYSVLSWALGGGLVIMSLARHVLPPATLVLGRWNPASYGVDPLVRLINLGSTATLARDLAVLAAGGAAALLLAAGRLSRAFGGRS